MTDTAMLPGLADIADRPVRFTGAAELPPHVKAGRVWRNTRSDCRGTWHLPANRGRYADALCGNFVPCATPDNERFIAEGDEVSVAACRRCLAKAARLDAVAAAEPAP